MRDYQPSGTYKFLYSHIIEELLFQICKRDNNYCVKNDKIPILIGKKFEEYRYRTLENMSGTRLDRHKLASCICGAIIEVKPLVGFQGATIRRNANEILALHVGLNLIKFYMMYSLVYHLNISLENKNNIILYLKENFDMHFPTYNENICDIQEYEENLLNGLYWTHQKCEIARTECFHYDIWAYSKIFYHLELYNKNLIENLLSNFIKNSK